MKRLTIVAGAAALTLFLAPPAWSQHTGFYLGGSIGSSRAKDSCDDVTGFSCDNTDIAWKVLAGYQLNRYLAAEFGYTDLGEFTVGAVIQGANVAGTAEVTAFELLAVGSLPPMDRFSAYAKLGLYYAETEYAVSGARRSILLGSMFFSQTGKESNSDLTFGFGLRYDFTRSIGIRGEWQRYLDVGAAFTGEDDIDVFSVELIWRF